ncbi:MAG: SDR family NAD(P)-dependent oxidoreductase [Alphaproteobacteria bacterium]|nr:SDR family NAD(P)-dependent oxidoreductase [Alphaproteobacteria bacterium]
MAEASGTRGSGSRGTGPRGLAVITGASSGLGLEFARLAAADGYETLLIARRHERLTALAGDLEHRFGTATSVLAADLADPADLDRVVGRLEAEEVGLLINNAGFGLLGPFTEQPAREIEDMLAVNVTALTRLARAVLPGMLARGAGRVLNVASMAAFQPGPMMAGYYASKAYVLSLSEALWAETRGTGVAVTALCPGLVPTEFQARAGMTGLKALKSRMVPRLDPTGVARAGYQGALAGRRIVVPGLRYKLMAACRGLMPRRLVLATLRRLQSTR